MRLSSTTFDHQVEVAANVARENPHLYFEIQSLNDYGTESLSALLYAVSFCRHGWYRCCRSEEPRANKVRWAPVGSGYNLQIRL